MQKRNTRDSKSRTEPMGTADAYTSDEVPNEGGKALQPDRNPPERGTRRSDQR